MKKLLLSLFLFLIIPGLLFSKGKKKKILTLSNGQYEEFFDSDSIEQIGLALYNVNTKKIIGFAEEADEEIETSIDDGLISRWLSLDPLASKYPSLSPYQFCANNPILFIDPDGKRIIINRSGAIFADNYTASTNLKTDNALNPFPNSVHDMGITGIIGGEKGVTYDRKINGSYDVSLKIGEYINSSLQKGWISDNKNPGLSSEVKAHEEGHGDQLVEAFNKSYSINSGYTKTDSRGKSTPVLFTGKADEILTQADKLYDNIKTTAPQVLGTKTKSQFIRETFDKTMTEVGKYNESYDREKDANDRAARKLGGKEKMPYTNHVLPIKL